MLPSLSEHRSQDGRLNDAGSLRIAYELLTAREYALQARFQLFSKVSLANSHHPMHHLACLIFQFSSIGQEQ